MAEAYLSREHNISWPWNMNRDKRNPNASLPGSDLVGFKTEGEEVHLVLGEVKTSTDVNAPPSVMNGRSDMTHQIDKLANDLSLVSRILRWAFCRCKGTEYEASFNAAMERWLDYFEQLAGCR